MTNTHTRPNEMLEARLGLRIAARLSDAGDALPHDISERLRHARMQALARRKRPEPAPDVLAVGNSLALEGPGHSRRWWHRMAAVLPVLALVAGLLAIDAVQNDRAAREIAQIDADLLIDDLPPAAYTDPGFLQFIRSQGGATR